MRRGERWSDPGDGDEGSLPGRLGAGCAIALVVLALIAGLIGIAIGARDRLAGWAEDDAPPPAAPPTPERPAATPP